MTRPPETADTTHPSDLVALLTVFMLIIGFTYSDDIVEFALDVAGRPFVSPGPGPGPAPALTWPGPVLVLALDCVLVAATAAVKWWVDTPRPDAGTFLHRLFTGAWGTGAALVVGTHVVMMVTAERRAALSEPAFIGIALLASLVYVVALTLLLLAALGGRRGPRTWVVPLVIGTYVVYVASALWYPIIDVRRGCAEEISPTYFSDMTEILAVVLIALGIELNFLRRTADLAADPGRRVSPVFTVFLLSVGITLAFSMLVKSGMGTPCGLAAVWHEYIAFVVTVQALAIGLTTLLWLLVSDAGKADPG